jgi:hypothetical protein
VPSSIRFQDWGAGQVFRYGFGGLPMMTHVDTAFAVCPRSRQGAIVLDRPITA